MLFRGIPGPLTGSLEGDLALGILAVALLLALRVIDKNRARNSQIAALTASLALTALSVAMFIDAVNAPNPQYANAPIDEASAARGKKVYEENCLACHGVAGHGDGPAAAALQTKPLDLTVHAFQHDQAYFTLVIGSGMAGMPPFRDRLPGDQIEDVIDYMRVLARQAQTY
ncbi:MAG: c-type cytochrome [Chloroflexota bacterium]|nr:c-type cytochrome [Chloroflexota bacterium]